MDQKRLKPRLISHQDQFIRKYSPQNFAHTINLSPKSLDMKAPSFKSKLSRNGGDLKSKQPTSVDSAAKEKLSSKVKQTLQLMQNTSPDSSFPAPQNKSYNASRVQNQSILRDAEQKQINPNWQTSRSKSLGRTIDRYSTQITRFPAISPVGRAARSGFGFQVQPGQGALYRIGALQKGNHQDGQNSPLTIDPNSPTAGFYGVSGHRVSKITKSKIEQQRKEQKEKIEKMIAKFTDQELDFTSFRDTQQNNDPATQHENSSRIESLEQTQANFKKSPNESGNGPQAIMVQNDLSQLSNLHLEAHFNKSSQRNQTMKVSPKKFRSNLPSPTQTSKQYKIDESKVKVMSKILVPTHLSNKSQQAYLKFQADRFPTRTTNTALVDLSAKYEDRKLKQDGKQKSNLISLDEGQFKKTHVHVENDRANSPGMKLSSATLEFANSPKNYPQAQGQVDSIKGLLQLGSKPNSVKRLIPIQKKEAVADNQEDSRPQNQGENEIMPFKESEHSQSNSFLDEADGYGPGVEGLLKEGSIQGEDENFEDQVTVNYIPNPVASFSYDDELDSGEAMVHSIFRQYDLRILKSQQRVFNNKIKDDLIWSFIPLNSQVFPTLDPCCQLINQFPDMLEIAQGTKKQLQRMKNMFPLDFNLFLPQREGQGKEWFNNFQMESKKSLSSIDRTSLSPDLPDSMLVDGKKFDFRVYSLITCCEPLTLFLHSSGLARISTQKANSESLEGFDPAFSFPCFEGNYPYHDQTLEWLFKKLEDQNELDLVDLNNQIKDLVIKTMISLKADLIHHYKLAQPHDGAFQMCFQLIGFDLGLTSHGRPILLKVEAFPTMVDNFSKLPFELPIIEDVLHMLNLTMIEKQRRAKHCHKGSLAYQTSTKSIREANKPSLVQLKQKRRLTFQLKHRGNFQWIYPIDTKNLTKRIPVIVKPPYTQNNSPSELQAHGRISPYSNDMCSDDAKKVSRLYDKTQTMVDLKNATVRRRSQIQSIKDDSKASNNAKMMQTIPQFASKNKITDGNLKTGTSKHFLASKGFQTLQLNSEQNLAPAITQVTINYNKNNEKPKEDLSSQDNHIGAFSNESNPNILQIAKQASKEAIRTSASDNIKSRLLFKTKQSEENYYKTFEETVNKIYTKRRSKLLSPAEIRKKQDGANKAVKPAADSGRDFPKVSQRSFQTSGLVSPEGNIGNQATRSEFPLNVSSYHFQKSESSLENPFSQYISQKHFGLWNTNLKRYVSKIYDSNVGKQSNQTLEMPRTGTASKEEFDILESLLHSTGVHIQHENSEVQSLFERAQNLYGQQQIYRYILQQQQLKMPDTLKFNHTSKSFSMSGNAEATNLTFGFPGRQAASPANSNGFTLSGEHSMTETLFKEGTETHSGEHQSNAWLRRMKFHFHRRKQTQDDKKPGIFFNQQPQQLPKLEVIQSLRNQIFPVQNGSHPFIRASPTVLKIKANKGMKKRPSGNLSGQQNPLQIIQDQSNKIMATLMSERNKVASGDELDALFNSVKQQQELKIKNQMESYGLYIQGTTTKSEKQDTNLGGESNEPILNIEFRNTLKDHQQTSQSVAEAGDSHEPEANSRQVADDWKNKSTLNYRIDTRMRSQNQDLIEETGEDFNQVRKTSNEEEEANINIKIELLHQQSDEEEKDGEVMTNFQRKDVKANKLSLEQLNLNEVSGKSSLLIQKKDNSEQQKEGTKTVEDSEGQKLLPEMYSAGQVENRSSSYNFLIQKNSQHTGIDNNGTKQQGKTAEYFKTELCDNKESMKNIQEDTEPMLNSSMNDQENIQEIEPQPHYLPQSERRIAEKQSLNLLIGEQESIKNRILRDALRLPKSPTYLNKGLIEVSYPKQRLESNQKLSMAWRSKNKDLHLKKYGYTKVDQLKQSPSDYPFVLDDQPENQKGNKASTVYLSSMLSQIIHSPMNKSDHKRSRPQIFEESPNILDQDITEVDSQQVTESMVLDQQYTRSAIEDHSQVSRLYAEQSKPPSLSSTFKIQIKPIGQKDYVASRKLDDFKNSKVVSNMELRQLRDFKNGKLSPDQLSSHVRNMLGIEKKRIGGTKEQQTQVLEQFISRRTQQMDNLLQYQNFG